MNDDIFRRDVNAYLAPLAAAMELMNRPAKPARPVQPEPQFDTPIEDIFHGIRGEWIAFWDIAYADLGPPNDHLTGPVADLRYVELQFPKSKRAPVRFSPEELSDVERTMVLDILTQELECME